VLPELHESVEGEGLAAAVEGDLERLALPAREAAALARAGTPVAHSVLMVLGRPTTRNARL